MNKIIRNINIASLINDSYKSFGSYCVNPYIRTVTVSRGGTNWRNVRKDSNESIAILVKTTIP